MRKILVIRLSSLGDIILTSPTVLNLKLKYPHSEICFLTKEQFSNIVGGLIGVDRVLTISSHARIAELVKLALTLDDEQFDLIVDLSSNFRSRLLATLVNATNKVTYSKHRLNRERLVRGKKFGGRAPHTIDSYNSALRKFDSNFPFSARRPLINSRFYLNSTHSFPTQIENWLNNQEEIVLIAPGARHETKRAPLELFRNVCEKLISEKNVKIVSVFQSAESDLSRHNLSLKSAFSRERFAEAVDLPLEALAFLLRQSNVTLSNDSAVAHLSSAVGTPVVAVFGPTHSALGFAPRGVFDKVIENDESCRPCSLHGSKKCSREERFCFTRLSVSAISNEIIDIIGKQKSLYPALFLDRDGTIIEEKNFLSDPADVVFYESAFEGLREARRRGYKLIIVTNQSGVARGLMSEDDVNLVNARVVAGLAEQGIKIDAVYSAPCHPEGKINRFRTPDNSRKPGESMFVLAALEHDIDLRRSWVIGDRATDYLSSLPIGGAGGALVLTGYGEKAKSQFANCDELKPQIVAADLAVAVSAILK